MSKLSHPVVIKYHCGEIVAFYSYGCFVAEDGLIEFDREEGKPYLANPKKVEYIDTNSDLLKSAITASLYWEVFRHSGGMADRVTPANPHQI